MLYIIIVTYNSAETISDCLTSITTSRLNVPHRVIVIDNQSTDETCSIIKDRDDKSLQLITNDKNIGFAKAVNQGLASANSHEDAQCFLLLNPDAKLHASCLQEMINFSTQHPTHGLISSTIFEPQKNTPWFTSGRIHWLTFKTTHQRTRDRYLKTRTYLTGCCLLITKSLYNTIGGFDERFFLYYEDADFSLRAQKAGYRMVTHPHAIAYHNESHSSDNDTKTYYLVKSGLHFFSKHMPLLLRPYFWLAFITRYGYHEFISHKKPVLQGMKDFWNKH